MELDQPEDGDKVAKAKDGLKSFARQQPWSYDAERKRMYRAKVGHLERLNAPVKRRQDDNGGSAKKKKK